MYVPLVKKNVKGSDFHHLVNYNRPSPMWNSAFISYNYNDNV